MVRFLAIILFFGLAMASGAAGYFANLNDQKASEDVEAPVEFENISATDLINDAPQEDKALRLTDFHFGRIPVGINLDDSKKDWEETYIPLFPNDGAVQKYNAICVIFQSDELSNIEEVEEFFDKKEIEGFYVQSAQDLPEYAFSNLAQKYKSLDYTRCVLLTSKKPEPLVKPTYHLALLGFAVFLSIAGWQSFALLGDLKSKIEKEKQAKEVSDAAGLSELFGDTNSDSKPETKPQSDHGSSSVESFLSQWTPDS